MARKFKPKRIRTKSQMNIKPRVQRDPLFDKGPQDSERRLMVRNQIDTNETLQPPPPQSNRTFKRERP